MTIDLKRGCPLIWEFYTYNVTSLSGKINKHFNNIKVAKLHKEN
jgi:hypothetical protein